MAKAQGRKSRSGWSIGAVFGVSVLIFAMSMVLMLINGDLRRWYVDLRYGPYDPQTCLSCIDYERYQDSLRFALEDPPMIDRVAFEDLIADLELMRLRRRQVETDIHRDVPLDTRGAQWDGQRWR